MRTSQQIYHRVRWDARFDPSRFILGIEQRGREPKRLPLPMFDPAGEIPWHRVLFFEADGVRVWDRSCGLDALDALDVGLAKRPRLLRAPFFEPRVTHVFQGERWAPGTRGGGALPEEIRVLTWNTLWDRYDSDRIHTARRRPRLLAALAGSGADVIALQEAEPQLLNLLLAEPWVREGWTVNVDPRGPDVEHSGLILLSRLPVTEAGWHTLSAHKAVAVIVVDTAAGPLVVATTHLTSDHSENGAAKRVRELAELREGLAAIDGDVVLAGDFNDGSDVPARRLDMADAWTSARGAADQTPTFDPRANPLATVSSLTGRAARLDRVLLRGLRATGADLVGDAPDSDGLFVSDHYGVAVTLQRGPRAPEDAQVLDTPPTARTAVAWIPPQELWAQIQQVRERLDPQVRRWPPHVNVLFGFVAESQFDTAIPQLEKAAAAVEAFDVRLEGVRWFEHRDDATLWLDPVGDGWDALHSALMQRFPACRGRGQFTAHLTLGTVQDPERAAVRIAPMTARVGELAVLSRRGDEPMRVRALIELGSRAGRRPGPTNQRPELPSPSPLAPDLARDRLAARLAADVTAALPEAVVHVVGSRATGTHLPDADLDLVAAVPGDPDIAAIEDRVAAVLPPDSRVRRLIGARVPGLRIHTPDLSADLVVAPTGAVSPSTAVDRRADLGEAIAISLSAVTDAAAVLALRPGAHVRQVKAWARARGLDAAPLGGLPVLAWTLMAARTGSIIEFFETWAAHDWAEPILTPTEPVRDLTAHLTPALRDLISEELYDAWEHTAALAALDAAADPLPGLLAAPQLHRRHAAWAVVTLKAADPRQLDDLEGRVRGRTRALLSALEDSGITGAHAWPRPFLRTPAELRFAIGLGKILPTRDALAALARPWLRGLTGVSVDLAQNGEIPTLT
jgi:endonuclease/exonuclease/phosphatase family metal-dependent hydrolase/2'-5' RNA ligase